VGGPQTKKHALCGAQALPRIYGATTFALIAASSDSSLRRLRNTHPVRRRVGSAWKRRCKSSRTEAARIDATASVVFLASSPPSAALVNLVQHLARAL
jgi:hypothetical protein